MREQGKKKGWALPAVCLPVCCSGGGWVCCCMRLSTSRACLLFFLSGCCFFHFMVSWRGTFSFSFSFPFHPCFPHESRFWVSSSSLPPSLPPSLLPSPQSAAFLQSTCPLTTLQPISTPPAPAAVAALILFPDRRLTRGKTPFPSLLPSLPPSLHFTLLHPCVILPPTFPFFSLFSSLFLPPLPASLNPSFPLPSLHPSLPPSLLKKRYYDLQPMKPSGGGGTNGDTAAV